MIFYQICTVNSVDAGILNKTFDKSGSITMVDQSQDEHNVRYIVLLCSI